MTFVTAAALEREAKLADIRYAPSPVLAASRVGQSVLKEMKPGGSSNQNPSAGLAKLAVVAIPFMIFLVMFGLLAFNAPIFDDYDAALESTVRLHDSPSFRDRLGVLVSQHNEHRIVVARFIAWVLAAVRGDLDFRLLALVGNIGLAGILFMLWENFRNDVQTPLIGAAGFIVCQMTCFESALMAMAACSNILVVAFSLAAFQFALRKGTANLLAGAALALLAAASQANGLFALPLIAVACALQGRWRRASLFGVVAVATWLLYFLGYVSPSHDGNVSLWDALASPMATFQMFLVVIGAIAPGPWPATVFGALLLVVLTWSYRTGSWRGRPAILLCIAFLVLSAAAVAAGRAGLGVYWASRYAIISSCLTAIAFLLVVERKRWTAPEAGRVFMAVAIGSLALSWAIWPYASAYSLRGHALSKPITVAGHVVPGRYFGIQHPRPEIASRILDRAEERGLFRAPEVKVFPAELGTSPEAASVGTTAGKLESLRTSGSRLVATGWSEVTATVQGRTFSAHSARPAQAITLIIVPREDLAFASRRLDRLYAGFRWEADYGSETHAREALDTLCLTVAAPGRPEAPLEGSPGCSSRASRRALAS